MTPSGSHGVETLQAPGRRRRRAGEQQHDPGEERQDTEESRRDLLRQTAERSRHAGGLRAPLAQLVDRQADERHREGQQVVDGAVDEERRQQIAR